jgi:hypothetical protein
MPAQEKFCIDLLTLVSRRVMKKAKYISRDMLEVPANERSPVYKPHIYIHDGTGREIQSEWSYNKLFI